MWLMLIVIFLVLIKGTVSRLIIVTLKVTRVAELEVEAELNSNARIIWYNIKV